MFDQDASKDQTEYRQLTSDFVKVTEVGKRRLLEVDGKALELLSGTAMVDIAHLLRPGHLQQLSNILQDSEASNNDKFVAFELLKNANIAAGMILPGCQDTGTAIVCFHLSFIFHLFLNLYFFSNLFFFLILFIILFIIFIFIFFIFFIIISFLIF